MARSLLDDSYEEDLPPYLVEERGPRESTLRRLSRALAESEPTGASSRSSSGPSVPYGGHTPRPSPVFMSMLGLHPGRLEAVLDAWFRGQEVGGVVTVQHRLQLRRPSSDGAEGWRIAGRVRRLPGLPWAPIVVELWPVHESFTRMTMTPQARVVVSRRYFRLGHRALDRFSADLAALVADPDPQIPAPPDPLDRPAPRTGPARVERCDGSAPLLTTPD